MGYEGKRVGAQTLSAIYSLIADLLLYPEERDQARIDLGLNILRQAPGSIRNPIETFIGEPSSHSVEEYVATLELAPPCPLYVGAYLFDESKSCRGAGMSGRNLYMIEIANIYRHFGFEMKGGELSDFLPLMVEFLAISLEKRELDRIGLRRCLVERYLLAGLDQMAEALEKYESPYGLLVDALKAALAVDLTLMDGQPCWMPPADEPKPEVSCPARLEAYPHEIDESARELKP